LSRAFDDPSKSKYPKQSFRFPLTIKGWTKKQGDNMRT